MNAERRTESRHPESGKTSHRDWTPIRSGKFYCSPRCGGGKFCLFSDFERATKDADKLAARMGDGWTPTVWENLGWYYCVANGIATIHTFKDRDTGEISSYSAWLEVDHEDGRLQVIVDAETPEDALGIATQKLRTIESRIRNSLAALNATVSQ